MLKQEGWRSWGLFMSITISQEFTTPLHYHLFTMSEFNNTSFSEPVGMNNTILTDQGVALVLIEPYLHRLYPGSTRGDLPSRLMIWQPLGACLVGRGSCQPHDAC